MNGLFSIFEPTVAKHLLVLIFLIHDPPLPLFAFPHRRIPWPLRRGFRMCS
jgi:hypothetical protein